MNNKLFVERREKGDYAVRRPGSARASAVAPTQHEAIEIAKRMGAPIPMSSASGTPRTASLISGARRSRCPLVL